MFAERRVMLLDARHRGAKCARHPDARTLRRRRNAIRIDPAAGTSLAGTPRHLNHRGRRYLLAWSGQEVGEVLHPGRVPQPTRRPAVVEGPILALAPEDAMGRRRSVAACRYRVVFHAWPPSTMEA